MMDATQQIAYRILSYLAENPDAQDTLKGITEWWLSEQPGRPNASAVKEVLAGLVEQGLVIESPRQGPQTYYKVNRERLEEIKALLSRFGSSDATDD